MKRKVTRAKTHDLSIVIPGIGSLGNDLPPTAKAVKMTMFEGDNGIEIEMVGHKVSYVVPYANVQLYFVEPLAEEPKVSKK